MNILDTLAPKHVLGVCLPLYDGNVSWQTWFRLREEEILLLENDIPWRLEIICQTGCSLIAHARNEAAAEAFGRGAEAILWVDGDINFGAGAITRWLSLGVDVVAAGVRRKAPPYNWNIRWLDENNIVPREDGLVEVESVGTGLMFTTKRVYEIMADRLGPSYLYAREDGSHATAYFETQKAQGEDVLFCKKWRELCGGKVWVDPVISTQHIVAPTHVVNGFLGLWLEQQKTQEAA